MISHEEILIAKAAADGVRLHIDPTGKIKALGDDERVKRWAPVIREAPREDLLAAIRSSDKTIFERACEGYNITPLQLNRECEDDDLTELTHNGLRLVAETLALFISTGEIQDEPTA